MNSNCETYGHQGIPGDDFVSMIAAFEGVFSFCVKHMFQLPCLKQTIIEQIQEKADFVDFRSKEGSHFILDLFVRTRLFAHLKYVNDKLSITIARKNRKAKKITHE